MLAEKTTIHLGVIPLEVFMEPSGRYVLSQTQVAEAVGKPESSFRDFIGSKSPEALPYKGFRAEKTSVKGNNAKINTIPIIVATTYWTKEATVPNIIAARLLGACAAESIERRADAAFGIHREEEERQAFMQARLEGKETRRDLTDAIKSYIDRHSELSENNRKWLYVNASQRVVLVVFGRKAKKLAEDLGVDPDNLRDALTSKELLLLREVEDTAVRLIDLRDVHPDDAVQQTSERLLIQVQNRLSGG